MKKLAVSLWMSLVFAAAAHAADPDLSTVLSSTTPETDLARIWATGGSMPTRQDLFPNCVNSAGEYVDNPLRYSWTAGDGRTLSFDRKTYCAGGVRTELRAPGRFYALQFPRGLPARPLPSPGGIILRYDCMLVLAYVEPVETATEMTLREFYQAGDPAACGDSSFYMQVSTEYRKFTDCSGATYFIGKQTRPSDVTAISPGAALDTGYVLITP